MLDFLSRFSAPPKAESLNAATSFSPPSAEKETEEPSPLEGMRFKYPLRKYQQEILELTRLKLERGERALHIVAPPGAGKTIIGLQIACELKHPALIISPTTTIQAQWGEKLSLFLPPDCKDTSTEHLIGTHEDKPLKPITLLTYQVLSTPGREQEYLERLAHEAWVGELVSGTANSKGAAELRILELMQNNKKAYDREISRHITRLRRKLTSVLDLKEVLHPNAVSLIQSLRRQKFRTVIFDECHHLTDYWAAIMSQVVKQLDAPLVIGLTGTPPEGKSAGQETRYMTLVGDIDYQVPTPALVREGGLAPFQDLVLFTRPTDTEEEFLALQHHAFHDLVLELTQQVEVGAAAALAKVEKRTGITRESVQLKKKLAAAQLEKIKLATKSIPTPQKEVVPDIPPIEVKFDDDPDGGEIVVDIDQLDDDSSCIVANEAESQATEVAPEQHPATDSDVTLHQAATTLPALAPDRYSLLTRWVTERLASAGNDGWEKFVSREADLAAAMCRYAWKFKIKLPPVVELSNDLMQAPLFIDDWMMLLEDFSLNYLKVSASEENHALYERIRQAIAKLGYGLTEKGLRKQASPVDRVLAFSRSKTKIVAEILQVEYRNLGERLRAVVVTDYEKMSATANKATKGVLSEESGGAIAVLKDLLADEASEQINPCLVTGSIILVDNRIAEPFQNGMNDLLKQEGYSFTTEMVAVPGEAFSQLSSNSTEWESRIYVGLATKLLEKGVSKVLVGTRGIFGEGWDCQALNTLVDLTTTTTPMSVKQLRGRSIRINTSDPLGACKVANNWDVVCIAPHLEKGLNDYQRFVRKHEGYFGICDDGQVECGVGHVHPAFSDLTPAEVFAGLGEFNAEMKHRALNREAVYELWKVGQHYSNVTIGCAEVTKMRDLHLSPPYLRRSLTYKEHAHLLRQNLNGVWLDYTVAALLLTPPAVSLSLQFKLPIITCIIFILVATLAIRRYINLYQRLKNEVCRPCSQETGLRDIGVAVLRALQKLRVIPRIVPPEAVRISRRTDGSLRVFLDTADPKHAQEFIKCVKEVIEPIKAQPYLIAKFEYAPGAQRKKSQKKQQEIVKPLAPKSKSAFGPGTKAKTARKAVAKNGATKTNQGDPATPRAESAEKASILSRAFTDSTQVTDAPPNPLPPSRAEALFFRYYLKGEAELRLSGFHAVPSIFCRSEKTRQAFQQSWNKHVSPGEIFATESKPEIANRYFGQGAVVSKRLLWE
ncbi:MAG: DEAD/DEAH box helicase family protein [Candidatus Obscuribacterales bacterium]|nr:DEAD/DEAH box helicase family protein [Candidatus Obscuribacterales bacterium]